MRLELTAPGVDCTFRQDCRCRGLAHAAGQRFLDTVLAACQARGWLTARGTQRTDSTHVLAAIRPRHRLEWVLEAMPAALHQRRAAAPTWVQQPVPWEGYTRSGLRSDQTRLPKDASTRDVLGRQVGTDGSQLLAGVLTADMS